MIKDMTKGSPWRLILMFSIPVFLGNMFQQLYSMVDTIIVGRLISTQALAAVGCTGAITFLVLGFSWGLSGGYGVIISQKFGAKDSEGVKKSIAMSIWLSVIVTFLLTAVALITAKPLLKLMNTPEDIFADAHLYIIIIYWGIIASILYNLIGSIVKALGDSKTPLYFLIISSVLNIILDVVFIACFNMGVEGAAIATVISQLFAGILCIIYSIKKYEIIRLKREHFKWDHQLVKAELKVGLPMAFQFSITAIGVIVLQSALNQLGSSVVAAYTAANKVENLVALMFTALGMTMATYCGQNVGAGDWKRVKKGMNSCITMSMITVVFGILINIFAGEWIVSLFMSNPNGEILGYAKIYLNIMAIFYPFLASIYVYRSGLQGIGDGFFPMLGGIGELVARLVVALTLPKVFGFYGICAASPVAWVAAAAILFIRYCFYMKKRMHAS